MRTYIVERGEKFTIEWYYSTDTKPKRKKSQASDYFESLTEDEQVKTVALFRRMAKYGIIRNKQLFRNEGDKIFAFKPKPDRFLCFFTVNKKIIITNGFRKKADKLPKNEKQRALKYKSDYEKKVKEGIYYE